MNLGLKTRAREKVQSATDYAKDALDTGMALTGETARKYAHIGAAQLQRAREHLPASFQRPSSVMVLAALGAGLLIGLALGGKASAAVEDLTESAKEAKRRRRMNELAH